MKLQTKLSLAFASTLAVVAIAGCPSMIPTPTTNASPSAAPAVASKLTGRLTFALGTNGSNPGEVLTVKLKKRAAGETTFSSYTATTSTDTAGNFTFSDLPTADYQVWYDDEGKVAAQAFNTTGLAVSDPVAVSATQSTVATQNLELAWDFTSNIAPEPNTNVTKATDTTFTWKAKNGVDAANTVYQVTVFMTSNTGSGAIVSAPSSAGSATSATTQTVNIPATFNGQSTVGTRYYVVKYWKKNTSFGNGAANFYGQTKPIPINVQ